MKVIDLYNLIANKEYDKLPNKIMLKNYDYIFTLREDCTGYKWYGEVNNHEYFGSTIHQNLEFVLNLEIISLDKIEEKKIPEKIDKFSTMSIFNKKNIEEYLRNLFSQQKELIYKLNEIIDYLKSKGGK